MARKRISVSQSMIKSFQSYKDGDECGLVFAEKYLGGKKDFPSSKVQRLGQWFEYIATGAPARGGIIPEPETLKDGKTLTKPYQNMKIQADALLRALAKYSVKLEKVGYKITKNGMNGTLDIWGTVMGKPAIVDIKSSGLLEDRWNDLGWHLDALPHKDRIMVQVLQYKHLVQMKHGVDPDFYFFVYSNTNSIEAKIIKIEVDPEKMERHLTDVERVRSEILFESQMGFIARPNVKKCSECPLADKCEHFIDVPEIDVVYY